METKDAPNVGAPSGSGQSTTPGAMGAEQKGEVGFSQHWFENDPVLDAKTAADAKRFASLAAGLAPAWRWSALNCTSCLTGLLFGAGGARC